MPKGDIKPWKRWIKFEAQLTNEKIHEIIVDNSNLIIEHDMPRCFENFIHHYAEYKWIVEKWNNNEEDIIFANKPYPYKEFKDYVNHSFRKLKYTQFNLQGHAFELDSKLNKKLQKNEPKKIITVESFGQE
ncbi:MAG: hypothetical protein JXR03_05830 [Cyclobacteriaceae bacterium]